MHSDFVSLSLPLCLFFYSATFPNVFLCLSFSALCLNPLQLLVLQLSLCPFICFYSFPSSSLFLFPEFPPFSFPASVSFLLSLSASNKSSLLFFNLYPFVYTLHPFLFLSPLSTHLPPPNFCLSPSLLLLAPPPFPSICATVLLFQLRSQLFPASAPSFPWRGSPPLPRTPSFPCFRGQPADVAQHFFFLHRQGEVMSRLTSSAQSECVCI